MLRSVEKLTGFEFFMRWQQEVVRFPSLARIEIPTAGRMIEMRLRSEEFALELRRDFSARTGEKLCPRALALVLDALGEYCAKGTEESPHRPFAARVG